MKKRKQGVVVCSNPQCSVEFEKPQSEINRNKRLGRNNYCSLSCSGKANHKQLIKWSNSEDNKKLLDKIRPKKSDKYTGLREHMNRVKKRGKDYDITLDDLLEQWVKQGGICVYSGIKLKHPTENGSNIDKASLDRIDSSIGYIKGNIQFISISCNHAKSTMTHGEMLTFCENIFNFYKNKK